ncbi:MAG: winged helix-turn-helix domain-containing protein [Planctomycetaceae bacterium]
MAGATPRDGVALLRGPQIQGILDREFGKTFSLNGVYKLLKRHGFVCREHAVMILDGAGWHSAHKLRWPRWITPED